MLLQEDARVCCCCWSSSFMRSALEALARALLSASCSSDSIRARSLLLLRCSSASARPCSSRSSTSSLWWLLSRERSRCVRSSLTTLARAESSSTCRRAWLKACSLAAKRSKRPALSARLARSLPARCCFTASLLPSRSRRAMCVSSRNWLDSMMLKRPSPPEPQSRRATMRLSTPPGASLQRRKSSTSWAGKDWKSTRSRCSDFRLWNSASPSNRLW
mmetsp:Transcript_48004/g.104489  ORF Transcript_48004/g.104489 Transcript_48004/m.104489 type:complete len:218 (-) Transcript_48004:263-916(-)